MFLMILCAICMLVGTSTLFFDAVWLHIIGGCLYFLGPVIVIFGIPLSVGLSDENSDNLYSKEGIKLDVDVFSRNGWISPQGKFYSCEYYGNSPAHEISAKNILLDCYGISSPIPGDKLIKFGWIKVTTAAGMFHIYEKDGMYDRMTDEQAKTFEVWCNSYGIYTRDVLPTIILPSNNTQSKR